MAVKQLVKQWLDIDEDASTREQIKKLYEEKNTLILEELLGKRIAFGTAGLRSKMEAGFNRLNNVTILQTSQGLAKYVLEQSCKVLSEKHPSIVIGHDHRHHSQEFARLSAVVFMVAGFKVYLLESPDVANDTQLVPTPFVPFAVDYYRANAGVMITASHNPAADNGYKVYWSNGCQIIPPNDARIAASILQNLSPWENVRALYAKFDDLKDTWQAVEFVKDTVSEKYYASLLDNVILDPGFQSNHYEQLKFVYTPVHGVGYEFTAPIFQQMFGLAEGTNFYIVKDQQIPDPDFKTVKFPNPEEKGALDLAIAAANRHQVDLIVANDPDADRFSAAVRASKTTFRQLTGNEIGFLFAYYVIEKKIQQNTDLAKVYLLNSTVSSQMIKAMAQTLGFNYSDTLTGFKWIGNKAIDLSKQGFDVPFGYEEAIGFMFPNVHDKDGIAALTVFLQLYYEYTIKQGVSLVDKLEQGFKKFGYFKEFNGYYKFTDLSITETIFTTIRNSYQSKGLLYPAAIGNDFTVDSWRDLTLGYESTAANNIPLLPVDTSSHMITAVLKPTASEDTGETVRFTARGSGTEPKLKVYIEGKASSELRAAQLAENAWFALRTEWFKPQTYNLEEVHP